MGATSINPRLRFFQLFLAALGVVILGLNIHHVTMMQRVRHIVKEYVSEGSMDSADQPSDIEYIETYFQLLLPQISMVLMYLTLATGRLRLKTQAHYVCRVVFSLAIAVGIVYFPAVYLNGSINVAKSKEAIYKSKGITQYESFSERYFCMAESSDPDTAQFCQLWVSRDMLSFFGGALIVVELIVARVVGDLGR